MGRKDPLDGKWMRLVGHRTRAYTAAWQLTLTRQVPSPAPFRQVRGREQGTHAPAARFTIARTMCANTHRACLAAAAGLFRVRAAGRAAVHVASPPQVARDRSSPPAPPGPSVRRRTAPRQTLPDGCVMRASRACSVTRAPKASRAAVNRSSSARRAEVPLCRDRPQKTIPAGRRADVPVVVGKMCDFCYRICPAPVSSGHIICVPGAMESEISRRQRRRRVHVASRQCTLHCTCMGLLKPIRTLGESFCARRSLCPSRISLCLCALKHVPTPSTRPRDPQPTFSASISRGHSRRCCPEPVLHNELHLVDEVRGLGHPLCGIVVLHGKAHRASRGGCVRGDVLVERAVTVVSASLRRRSLTKAERAPRIGSPREVEANAQSLSAQLCRCRCFLVMVAPFCAIARVQHDPVLGEGTRGAPTDRQKSHMHGWRPVP
jgi:hypothetical protein